MTNLTFDDRQLKPRQPTDWRLLPLTLGLYVACLFSGAAPKEVLSTAWPISAALACCLGVLVLVLQFRGPQWSTTVRWTKTLAVHAGLLLAFLVPVLWSQATTKSEWQQAGLASPEVSGAVVKAQLVLGQPLQERTNRFGATTYQAPAGIIGVEAADGTIRQVQNPWPVWLSTEHHHPADAGSVIKGIVQVESAGPFSRIQAYARLRGPVQTVVAAEPTVFTKLRERLQELGHAHHTGLSGLDVSTDQQRGRALIASMIVGDTSAHDEQLRDDMKTAGLSHLSAVSGANCALVFGVVTAILRRIGLPRWCQVAGSLTALTLFVLVVGTEPSVLRAAVMGVVGAVAVFSGRGRKTMPLLFVACILLLTLDPWYSTDLAFQLSVAATWGIVAWGKPLSELFPRWLPTSFNQALAVAIAAQFATIPVLGPATGSIPTHSVLANLVVTPLVPLVTLLGTASLPFLLWFPEVATVLLYPVGWFTIAVGFVGYASAQLPLALLPWPEGIIGYLLGFGVLITFGVIRHVIAHRFMKPEEHRPMPRIIRFGSMGGWLRFYLHGPNLLWILVSISTVMLLVLGWFLRPHGIPKDWSVVACDVGQGDMFVLNSGSGSAVIVDAGPDPQAAHQCLNSLKISKVDHIFISHQHADHYAGLEGVLSDREVNDITYGSAQQSIVFETGGLQPQRAHPGQTWTFSSAAGSQSRIEVEVLAAKTDPGASENDASTVLHVTFQPAGVNMLFTGDLEEDEFAALARNNRLPNRVHALKVAHHGARNGGQQAVRTLEPEIALISVGKKNDYGHPHPDITAALNQVGSQVMRTDELGSIWIRFTTDSFTTGRF